MSDSHPIVSIENLTRGYTGQKMLRHEFDFKLSKGDFCFVVGKSGSGKTSLMKLITRQITPPLHTVYVHGDDVAHMNANEVQDMRRHIGVIYQDYKLLSDRSVLENIVLPLQLQDADEKHAKERAHALAQEFDFSHQLNTKVSLLSG
jgi:cell division transport system ATP-binding protein